MLVLCSQVHKKNQFLVWEAAASYGMAAARKLLEMIFLFSKPQAQEMEKKFLFAISLSSAELRKAWQFEKSECFFRGKNVSRNAGHGWKENSFGWSLLSPFLYYNSTIWVYEGFLVSVLKFCCPLWICEIPFFPGIWEGICTKQFLATIPIMQNCWCIVIIK